jgi:hypothetical protein
MKCGSDIRPGGLTRADIHVLVLIISVNELLKIRQFGGKIKDYSDRNTIAYDLNLRSKQCEILWCENSGHYQ